MRSLFFISKETFLLLRRDQVFLPVIVASILIAAFANLASSWTFTDLRKVLFDIGIFGFHLTGGIVALFWGHRMIADSRQEGALEVQLASPVSRSAWLLGKYLGLAFALLVLGALMLAIWQLLMALNGFGLMTRPEFLTFLFTILGWLVLAALALLLATFSSPQVTLFAALCLWVAGLSTSLVEATLTPETPEITKKAVGLMARYWDLQQFNLVDWTTLDLQVTAHDLAWKGAYGLTLILLFLTAGALIFKRRDLA